jgi:hypothetical protein
VLSAVASARKHDSLLQVGVNHVSSDTHVPAAAVERALGRAPDLVVPHDRLQARALAQGRPLVFSQPAAALPAALGAFVMAFQEARQPNPA